MKAQPFSRYFLDSHFYQEYLYPTVLPYRKVDQGERTALEVLKVEIRNIDMNDRSPLWKYGAKCLALWPSGIVVIPLACTGILVNVALLVTGKNLKERVKSIFLDARNAGAFALIPATVALLASRFSLFTITSPLTVLIATTVTIAALILQLAISCEIALSYTTFEEKLKPIFGLVDSDLQPLQSIGPRGSEEKLVEEVVLLYQEYRILLFAYCQIATEKGTPLLSTLSQNRDVFPYDLPTLPGENRLLRQILIKKYDRAKYLWASTCFSFQSGKYLTWNEVIQRTSNQNFFIAPTIFQKFTTLPFPDDLSHWKELVEIAQFAPEREVLRMFFGLAEGFSPEQLQEAVEPLKQRFENNADFLELIEAVRSGLTQS